ncbi:hypothetical protein [Microbacterium testaceum]|uniref:hypothetical protein n=1 Tax=Microbacterium testaceum TaxID=2033 RepID=UPI00381E4AD7
MLLVITAAQLVGMGVEVFWAWLSYVPFFAEVDPRPIPAYDFFWPSLALVGGLAAILAGWVVIIRAVSLAWPARSDRSRRDAP